ncbi:hypothetical protein K7432_005626 [Basidiobolus ranarum]|uniref:Uncharacterized protein n=1 Tax=Basidiobolus ranarum TaxID=34480 RepID=A0ABR2W2Z4_9FUNG
MFIGDRGHGIGSRIKGHVKYGGKWKETIHSRYTSVFVTDEHNSSQTCVFCFEKLAHPTRIVSRNDKLQVKEVKGTFRCLIEKCILSFFNNTHKGRDSVSAFAIGLAGASNVLLESCFPAFDPGILINQTHRKKFKEIAEAFLKENALKYLSGGENTL